MTLTAFIECLNPAIGEDQPQEEQKVFEEEEDVKEQILDRALYLIKCMELTELTTLFSLSEQHCFHLPRKEMFDIYKIVQTHVIEIFGAPISEELFPKELFEPEDTDK